MQLSRAVRRRLELRVGRLVTKQKETMMEQIKVGDTVQTGVSVLGNWVPMSVGIVVSQTSDRSVSGVDIMSLHGGAPWVIQEQTTHLRKVPMMSADGGKDIPL